MKLDANVDAIGLRLVIVMKWQGIGNKVRNDTFQGRIQDFQRGGGGGGGTSTEGTILLGVWRHVPLKCFENLSR